jgi:hypothetical protein
MKTTISVDDGLMRRVKQAAAAQKRTMSEFIESALRLALQSKPEVSHLKPLPTFQGGPFLTNIADNDSLQDFIENR